MSYQASTPVSGLAARAAPYEKGTETLRDIRIVVKFKRAARAAPYEKGTETAFCNAYSSTVSGCRARGPL